MNSELQSKLESLQKREQMYYDYWLALNNNTEEEKEYNKKMKEQIDIDKALLEKQMIL